MNKKFLAALTILPFTACSQNNIENQQPNIVFILADDMGYGDVSYLNPESKIQTENLDCLASDGIVFTDAHSSSSVSTPTRYGIMTGRYNWRSVLKNGVLGGYSRALIPEDRETMASMLQKQGYTTAGIGKWHLGWNWNNIDAGIKNIDYTKPVSNGPTTRGFDYFYGFCGSLDMAPYVYIENDMPTSVPDRVTVNKGKYSWWRKGPTGADFKHEEVLPNLTNRACKYISEKSKSDKPYFLYLPLPAPHTPILPTEEFRGKSGLGEYGDFVLMVDSMIGRVMTAIEESGESDNTIVVFTADNGCSPAAGIKELQEQGHFPSHIYRGHKADLFDGGHRIPCIMRWPAKTKHHFVNETVCLTDFYSTFAAINNYKLKDTEGEDSFNLLPVILSKKDVKSKTRADIYSNSIFADKPIREATIHHSIYGQFTIRQGEWKLLVSPSSGGWSEPVPNDKKALEGLPLVQLYNMAKDPSEKNNVEAEYPEIVTSLQNLLIKYIEDGRSTPGEPQSNEREANWKQFDYILTHCR